MPPFDDLAAYEQQSPTLLAAQPPTPKKQLGPAKNWDRIYEHLESRLTGLRAWRYSWWTYWADLAKYLLPRRYSWLVTANRMWRGNPINNAIIDSTGTLAMQICAAGLWTGLTSPSRPWFKLGVGVPWIELDAEGKAWLEDVEKRVYTVLGQSNFYTILAQAFQDVTTFGTAPVIIYEDAEDIIRLFLPCAGEYYLAVGSRLSVDTLYREFTLTVAEIVEMFGLENCPPDVQKLWQTGGGSWQTEFVIAHAIEPNSPLSSHKIGDGEIQVVPASFTFREIYWLRSNNSGRELSRRGFHERPFMAARWSVVSNDAYGRSPGMDALGDTKQLQLETLRKAEFIEKLVRPPMGADPAMQNQPASVLPANITFVNTENGKKGFWPLYEVQPAALGPLVQDVDKIEERINRCFFVDIFMAISRMEGVQPRNELELTKRDLERLQVLGPFINLFETEFAGPAIQRILAILQRRKLLKPQPQSLRGVPLKIDYISIMKLAQRSAESIALKDVLATGASLTEAAQLSGQRAPLRIINLDEAMREYADLANANPKILFTEDQVQEMDDQRAKAQQQRDIAQATPAAASVAKDLSQAQIAPGNALGAILGHGGGAPINTSGGGQ